MSNNYNQSHYSVNLQENNRKNSEVPTNVIGKSVVGVQNNLSDDDEDYGYTNPNINKKHNWTIDGSRMTNSMFDRHISKQIAQQISRPIPYSTILLVILAVFVSGFKGTAFLLVDLKDEEDESRSGGYILRAFWRQILITLSFVPLVYQEYTKEKREEIEDARLYQKEHIFNKQCLITIAFCSFTYAVWIGTMAYSVFHTSVANVYIFNNIYPLFLVLFKLFSFFSKSGERQPPSNSLEKFGAFIAILVLVLLMCEDSSVFHAELVALVGAFSASIYYSNLQKIVYEYPYMLAVILLSSGTTFFFGLYSLIFEGSTFNTNTSHGLFGVFSLKWIFIHIIISLLTGVVSTKLFTYISSQIKTMYVDMAIMSEAFAALILAVMFGYQELPNLTQCAIYFFYIVALIMLAVGKSEAQIEQISLHDENNLNANPAYSGFRNPNSKHTGIVQNTRGSYIPPSQFATPNHKQQQLVVPKKNTIGYVHDMAMTDFAKINQYRNNSILEGNHEPPKVQTPQNNQNQAHYSNAPINTIMEQEEELLDSRYMGQSQTQNTSQQHNNNYDNRTNTLNDSISDFNRQFLQNLKNKTNI